MATSGSCYSDFGTNGMYRLQLNWTRNSVDIANNKSNVTVTAYIISRGSSYNINSSATKNGTMTINGTSYGFTFKCGLSGNSTIQIYSKTVDIYHNADGSKSFGIAVSGTIDISFSSGKVGTISTSGTATLDNIPRTSGFSLSTTTATMGTTQVTAYISRASTAFTHNVYVVFGSDTRYAGTGVGTSVSWIPPVDLANQIPNATTGIGTVCVETWHGSTYIGTTYQSITYNVPASVKPSFSNLGAEIVNAGADVSYGYVQGKSKCLLSVWGATGSYGSSITGYRIEGNGASWSTWQATTGILHSAGTFSYSAYIIDSRGRTSDKKNVSITVQSYSPPTITGFYANRSLSTGAYNEDGTYIKAEAAYTYHTLSNKNTISTSVQYKRSTVGDWSNGGTVASGSSIVFGGGGIATAYAYDVRITVSDKFTLVSKIMTVNPSFVTLDFKAGGRGIGIGKESTNDTLDVAMSAQFDQPVQMIKGKYVYEGDVGGRSGTYMKIANISVSGEWINTPLTMQILQRGTHRAATLHISFSGHQYPKDLIISGFHKEGEIYAYISGSGGSFSLYIAVTGAWDVVSVVDVSYPPYLSNSISIAWSNEMTTSVPSGYVTAQHRTPGQNWNGRTLCVNADGVVEVGRYLDFTLTADSTADYDSRMWSNGWAFVADKPWIPNGNGATHSGDANYRWNTVYSVNGINASSDRSLKENICYVNSKSKSSAQITYGDMYNFIKDDLGLAEYNFKKDDTKSKKLNFIAQDILVNEDGSDNVVGQLIVNPVAVPTKQEIKEAKAKLEEGQVYEYPTLSYDTATYTSVIAGALKEAIFKIEELTIRIEELEKKYEVGDEE